MFEFEIVVIQIFVLLFVAPVRVVLFFMAQL